MYRICILSLLLFACKGNNTSENTPTEEPVTEQREQTAQAPKEQDSRQGILYNGILPTPDGKNVDTTVILGENNTYTKTERYIEDGHSQSEKGRFQWNGEDKTILLIGENGSKATYRVDAQVLILLPDPNKKMSPAEEERYTKNKKKWLSLFIVCLVWPPVRVFSNTLSGLKGIKYICWNGTNPVLRKVSWTMPPV